MHKPPCFVSELMVVGSIPTVARHIFQASLPGVDIYTLRVTSQASYSPEYITPTQLIYYLIKNTLSWMFRNKALHQELVNNNSL